MHDLRTLNGGQARPCFLEPFFSTLKIEGWFDHHQVTAIET